MDIMQVLQNICKSPEAHDKGTEAMSPYVHDMSLLAN